MLNYKRFEVSIFHRAYDDKHRPEGFMFVYAIVTPSKKWEGLQGFLLLEKINNIYKITGIDIIP